MFLIGAILWAKSPFVAGVRRLAPLVLKVSRPARWSVVNKIDFAILTPCFSLFGLLSQNTIDWVADQQQQFTSHSSGAWKVQD